MTEQELLKFKKEQSILQSQDGINAILSRLAELDVILPRSVEDLYNGKLTVAPQGRTLEAYNEKKELRAKLKGL